VLRKLPRRLRVELYHLRRLGPSGYARHNWWVYTKERSLPRPSTAEPFDIGGSAPIVLHESTLDTVTSHWLDREGIEELDAFRRVALGCSTFLDIGAAQGIFSAAFCAITGGHAYALEPSQSMWPALVALIELNPEFEITPFQLAVGATAGSQAVEAHGAQFRRVTSAEAATDTMEVETLDDFAALHGVRPEFVKIDVEGMELDVLRGGAATFREVVEVIMLEIHPRILMQGEGFAGIQELLTSLGFRLLTLQFAPIADLAGSLVDGRGIPLRVMNVVCQKVPAST